MKSLKIVNIEPNLPFKHPDVAHPVLPQHPFALLGIASPGMGKTNFVINLILNQYKGYFHDIQVYSPTIDNDPKWLVVKKAKGILAENKRLKKILNETPKVGGKVVPKIIHKSIGDEQKYIDEQERQKPKFDGKMPEEAFQSDMSQMPDRMARQKEKLAQLKKLGYEEEGIYIIDRTLIVLDDQAGLFDGNNTNNPMVNFFFKRRHFNASIMTLTQAKNAIPKPIRIAHDQLILFRCANLSERQQIYEEWPTELDTEQWYKVYRMATKEPHSFLYINNKFPLGDRMYKNFEHKFVVPEDTDDEGEETSARSVKRIKR